MATLYERLGGANAIAAVVEDFVARCAADPRIGPKFERTDIPRLKAMLVDQIDEATGGPARYRGRTMEDTHRGMGVTAGEFDALVQDLVATLDRFGVGNAEKEELLEILAPLRAAIVEVDSAETGTPLPSSYEPAAPLYTM
jgi:hemoglobin